MRLSVWHGTSRTENWYNKHPMTKATALIVLLILIQPALAHEVEWSEEITKAAPPDVIQFRWQLVPFAGHLVPGICVRESTCTVMPKSDYDAFVRWVLKTMRET